MTIRQQAGAALVGTTVLAGAALPVPDLSAHGVPDIAARAIVSAVQRADCRFDGRTLIAMAAIESGFGTSQGSELDPVTGVATKRITSSAGAEGPLQFIPPTWAAYATDGDGDGVADIDNVWDSSAAAAALLCASNIDENWEDAVGSYNGGAGWRNYSESTNYVAQVRERVDALPPLAGLPALPPLPGGQQAATGAQGRHDGLTLRVTDALLGSVLDGWDTLNGRAQEHKAEAPDLARLFADVDEHQRRYTDPEPGAASTGRGRSTPGSAGQVTGSVDLVCPIAGPVEHRSDFGDPRSGGRSHAGNDLFAEHGTPVVSPVDGVVTDVANDEATTGLGGLAVWIRAEGGPLSGWQFYLAHNERNVATVGQRVRAGQIVAFVGDTGNASADAPHVHLQLHPGGGAPIDPYPYTSAACAANRRDT